MWTFPRLEDPKPTRTAESTFEHEQFPVRQERVGSLRLHDMRALHELYARVLATVGEAVTSQEIDELHEDMHNKNATLFIARDTDIKEHGTSPIVGSVLLVDRRKEYGLKNMLLRSAANICNLAVKEKYGGRHISRKLMQAAFAEAKQKGFTKVLLEVAPDNTHARSVYERFGFQQVSERTQLGTAGDHPLVTYIKEI